MKTCPSPQQTKIACWGPRVRGDPGVREGRGTWYPVWWNDPPPPKQSLDGAPGEMQVFRSCPVPSHRLFGRPYGAEQRNGMLPRATSATQRVPADFTRGYSHMLPPGARVIGTSTISCGAARAGGLWYPTQAAKNAAWMGHPFSCWQFGSEHDKRNSRGALARAPRLFGFCSTKRGRSLRDTSAFPWCSRRPCRTHRSSAPIR